MNDLANKAESIVLPDLSVSDAGEKKSAMAA
jgi:hypothetical protein